MSFTPLDMAKAFIQAGELPDALSALDDHLKQSPTDSDARRIRAEVRMRSGSPSDLRGALDDYAQLDALALSPDDTFHRSVIYERLGDIPNALQMIESGRAAYPTHDRLTERHLHLLRSQGEIAAALAILDALPRTWRWLQWAGDLNAQRGDHAQAIANYSAALDLFSADDVNETWALPLRARLLMARGERYLLSDQYDFAEADYLAAETLIPGDPVVPFNRGLIAARRGDLESAAQLCKSALESASPFVREHLRNEIASDGRYAALLTRL